MLLRASTRASAVPVPRSRKDAVLDASTCLKQALRPRKGGRRNPSTRSRTGTRVVVELPVAQDGASDLARIAEALLRDGAPSRDVCLLFEDLEDVGGAREALSDGDVEISTFESDLAITSKDDAQLHVAVSPETWLKPWLRARPNSDVVALNPRLQDEDMQELGFQVVYSLMPVSAKAFGVGATIEAAVVKRSGRGPIASYPYEVFVRREGRYECVASTKSRPTERQLEDVLYAEASRGGLVATAKRIFQGMARNNADG